MSTSPFLYATLSGAARAPAGTLLIRTGQGSAWVIYSSGAAGTYVGGQFAVLLVPLQPGQSGPVQTSGFVDPDILSLGPGPAGLVYAGPTPSRTGSQVIGTCDSSGLLTLRTAYSTTSVVDTIGGSPWSGTPSLGQVPTFTSNGWTPATPTSGGGAGSTTLLADFTQPGVGSSVGATVGNTVAFTLFAAVSVNGGSYLVTAVADATHCTLLNLGGLFNAAVGATLHAGVVVAPVGGSAPLAPAARGEGQVLMLAGGNDTPTGLIPTTPILSLVDPVSGATVKDTGSPFDALNNWRAIQHRFNTSTGNERFYFGKTAAGTGNIQTCYPLFPPQYCDYEGIFTARTGSAGIVCTIDNTISKRLTAPAVVLGFNVGRDPTYSTRSHDGGTHTINTALIQDGVSSGWLGRYNTLCLNDNDCGSVNGFGAMTLETFYYTGPLTSGSPIFTSELATVAITIIGSHVTVQVNTTGGLLTFTSAGTFSANTFYDLAITWDGQTVKLWVNGVADANTAATGSAGQTVVQPFNSDIGLAVANNQWPWSGNGGTVNAGAEYGSIHLSNINRYSGGGVNNVQEFVADTHTCVLFNFGVANRSVTATAFASDAGQQGWVIAQSSVNNGPTTDRGIGAPVWYPWHGSEGGSTHLYTRWHKMSLASNGDAVYVYGSQSHNFDSCSLVGQRGITLAAFSYGCALTDCLVQQIGHASPSVAYHSWGIGSFSEFLVTTRCQAFGFRWCRVYCNYTGVTEIEPYSDCGTDGAVYCTMFSYNCIDAHFYVEGTNPTDSIVRFDSVYAVNVMGGVIGDGSGAVSCAKLSASPSEGADYNFRCTFEPASPHFAVTVPVPGGSPIKVSGEFVNNLMLDTATPALVRTPLTEGGVVTVNVSSGGGDITLTQDQFFAHTIIITDTGSHWSSGQNVILPFAVAADDRVFWNKTSQTVTFKVSGATGPAVSANTRQASYADGTNWN